MRSQRFGPDGGRQDLGPRPIAEQAGEGAHLFSPTGFLDDAWWHRSYWVYGRTFGTGFGGWMQAGHHAPAGNLLVVGGAAVYGYGRKPEYFKTTTPVEYRLFAAGRDAPRPVVMNAKRGGKPAPAPAGDAALWSEDVPLQVRAMVLAGGTLFVAGPPRLVDEEEAFRRYGDPAVMAALADQSAALAGRKGAILWAVSAADGRKLAECRLASMPVFDGMAAAGGRLYFSTADGKVICMGDGQ
jgi:hypothetical protein